MTEQFSFDNIEVREPILDADSEKSFDAEHLKDQWGLLTEAVRREALGNLEARAMIAQYVTTPVSEALPRDFLSGLSSDPRVKRLAARYAQEIGVFLALPPVPDEILTPDISNAPKLESPQRVLRNYDEGTEAFHIHAKHFVDKGSFAAGVTENERRMVAKRYRFARDIKVLALGTELLDQQPPFTRGERGEIVLPSQTTIDISPEAEAQHPELLEPHKWIKREQLKDRVYIIEVGSSKYVLKEKKTARHTDTKQRGHKPGLSSLEEIQTAGHFNERGRVEQGDYAVSWEQPIAAVTFPDGFQFAVFEYQEGMTGVDAEGAGSLHYILSEAIKSHKPQFEKEFAEIRVGAGKFWNDYRAAGNDQPREGALRAVAQLVGLRKTELTFEDFALIKAFIMQRQAQDLLRDTVFKQGYFNSDQDGFAFKVLSDDQRLQLEIIGFDFEYFKKMTREAIATDEFIKMFRQQIQEEQYGKNGLYFTTWPSGETVTRMQAAGYLALLEKEGILKEQKV